MKNVKLKNYKCWIYIILIILSWSTKMNKTKTEIKNNLII